MTLGNSLGQIFQTTPTDFPLFVPQLAALDVRSPAAGDTTSAGDYGWKPYQPDSERCQDLTTLIKQKQTHIYMKTHWIMREKNQSQALEVLS